MLRPRGHRPLSCRTPREQASHAGPTGADVGLPGGFPLPGASGLAAPPVLLAVRVPRGREPGTPSPLVSRRRKPGRRNARKGLTHENQSPVRRSRQNHKATATVADQAALAPARTAVTRAVPESARARPIRTGLVPVITSGTGPAARQTSTAVPPSPQAGKIALRIRLAQHHGPLPVRPKARAASKFLDLKIYIEYPDSMSTSPGSGAISRLFPGG